MAIPQSATDDKAADVSVGTIKGTPTTDTDTFRFAVSNLSCASCVARLEKALGNVDGLSSVAVNLATHQAAVSLSSGKQELTQIIDTAMLAAESAGYPLTLNQPIEEQSLQSAKEHQQLKRHLLIAALLSLPVFLIEMGGHVFPAIREFISATIGLQSSWIIQFALTTMVMIWPGRQFYLQGFPRLLKAAPDMNSLVALGTLAAWLYSSIATFLPQLLPENARHVYFEAAAVVVTLILAGRYLEARAKGKTGQAIGRLLELQQTHARVQMNNAEQYDDIAIDQVKVGDQVLVRPGERIALDGLISKGDAYIDESMLTGEPMPVDKKIGDPVTGGTINGNSSFHFKVTRHVSNSVLSQIVELVQQAQSAKLPIQELVNRITIWFVPLILLLSVATIIVWLLTDNPTSIAFITGISVLIIACPCAMGLATPTSVMVGTGRAAQLGVLFRRGDALQSLSQVQTIALDKTGTLTMGKPALTDCYMIPTQDTPGSDPLIKDHVQLESGSAIDASVLQAIASIEQFSEHPLASAFVDLAREHGLPMLPVESFKAETSKGVSAEIDHVQWHIGSRAYLQDNSIDLDTLTPYADLWTGQGKSALYVARQKTAHAILGISDPIKPSSKNAVNSFHQLGLKVVMITGDQLQTANHVASKLGIDQVIAGVLPAGKADAIKQLQSSGNKVAFVGDGINDAPALALADTGIALGHGSGVAVESGDVVLMSDNLEAVTNALSVSKKTLRNIKQNLWWAFGYNVVLIPIAAGVLYPYNGLLLSPMFAAAAMALSSVFVVSNALRLRNLSTAIKK